MGKVRGYKDLMVWQRGVALAVEIYRVTETFPAVERYGLTSQIRQAAVSIASNLAEEQERHTRRAFAQFINIAPGYAAELDTQLLIAHKIGYLSSDALEHLSTEWIAITRMLYGLLRRQHTKL